MEKLILVDLNKDLCEEWKLAFREFNEVEIIYGRFESVKEYDCMVSPANSFGLMDGGIDLAIAKHFGSQLPERVRKYILENHYGEQNVGTSFIVETGDSKHPYLAHTPTMRVPMAIDKTENVYLAMKAMFQAVSDFNKHQLKIKTILCPGLGTATGKVSPKQAAQQMLLAYKSIKQPPISIDWDFARKRNTEIKNSIIN